MNVELNDRKLFSTLGWIALGVCAWHFARGWGLAAGLGLRFALPDIEDVLRAARLAVRPAGKASQRR